MNSRRLLALVFPVYLILIFAVALAGVLFGRAESSTLTAFAPVEIANADSAQILSLWPVTGAAPGATAKLWAQVKNSGNSAWSNEARVWFWVDGPNWSANHWVGSALMPSLAPGADEWYSFEWTISADANEGDYTYWAQVWTSIAISDWSSAQGFSVVRGNRPGKPILISPSGNITTMLPTFSWSALANAMWYQLWVNETSKGTPVVKAWYTREQLSCGSGTGICIIRPTEPLIAGTYQWWVQAWNNDGYGQWSNGMSFTLQTGLIGPYNIEFVTVPAGEFQMGSNNRLYPDEQPVHRVVISKSFQLGKYEITQRQWKAVMGFNPSWFQMDENQPVEKVSWNDAQQFIAKLNAGKDGFLYRLPTEAEWEYACRAGTTGDYGGTGNLDEMAWYGGNSGRKPHVVGSKKPNAWGLYDMHGNVFEWTQDWYFSIYYSLCPLIDPPGPYSGTERVARGGSWGNDDCRSSTRCSHEAPNSSGASIGFRIARAPQ